LDHGARDHHVGGAVKGVLNKVFDVVILHKIRFRLLTWVKFGIIITQEKPFVNRKFSQMSMLLAKY
jgi:hypothetical protein